MGNLTASQFLGSYLYTLPSRGLGSHLIQFLVKHMKWRTMVALLSLRSRWSLIQYWLCYLIPQLTHKILVIYIVFHFYLSVSSCDVWDPFNHPLHSVVFFIIDLDNRLVITLQWVQLVQKMNILCTILLQSWRPNFWGTQLISTLLGGKISLHDEQSYFFIVLYLLSHAFWFDTRKLETCVGCHIQLLCRQLDFYSILA